MTCDVAMNTLHRTAARTIAPYCEMSVQKGKRKGGRVWVDTFAAFEEKRHSQPSSEPEEGCEAGEAIIRI